MKNKRKVGAIVTKEELRNKLDEWIEQQRLDEYELKTLKDYKSHINKFIDFIPTDNFVLNKNLTIAYKSHLKEKGFRLNSRNKYIIVLNKFLKFIKYDDCTLKKEKTQQKTSLDDPLWEQEHKRMLRWARRLGMEDMYLIMKIFAYAGIRVVELKKFTVPNLEKAVIKAVYNKGKERNVILRGDLLRELRKYCKDNKITSGYIFRSPEDPTNPDKMVHITTIWRRLKRIARAAKINPDKVHAHAWRHLFAKAFMKIPGNSIDELADILGHTRLETTRIYTMTSTMEKKKKLEKISY